MVLCRAVLVGDEQTEMFDLHTGVRRCVMSPVPFSFFINGAREIREKTKGVCVGDIRVRLLLYADDIVSRKDLQIA